MPMSEALHAVLKEKLADAKVKIDEREVTGLSLKAEADGVAMLDLVSALYDKYEAITPIQSANKVLADKKREMSATIEASKTELAKAQKAADDARKELERVMGDSLSDTDKKAWLQIKQRGMTEETEAKLNAAIEQANQYKTQLDAVTIEKQKLLETTTQVTRGAAEGALKNKFLIKAADKGFIGKRGETLWLMKSQTGEAKVEISPTGEVKEIYRKYAPDGRVLESNLDSLIESYAADEELAFLRVGSTSGGTGQEHKGSQGGGGVMTYRQMISKKE